MDVGDRTPGGSWWDPTQLVCPHGKDSPLKKQEYSNPKSVGRGEIPPIAAPLTPGIAPKIRKIPMGCPPPHRP